MWMNNVWYMGNEQRRAIWGPAFKQIRKKTAQIARLLRKNNKWEHERKVTKELREYVDGNLVALDPDWAVVDWGINEEALSGRAKEIQSQRGVPEERRMLSPGARCPS